MKASVLSLTYGRLNLTKQTLKKNLDRAGIPFEWLHCDQGSGNSDAKEHSELVEYIESLNPTYFRKNSYNEGIPRSLNQLLLRSSTNYFFFLPNDILLPDQWLKKAVYHAENIELTGIVGFEGQDLVFPEIEIQGINQKNFKICYQTGNVLEESQVFGAVLLTRKLINTVGYFCEDYHPYAFEDSDMCFRAKIAGLLVYYMPGEISHHLAPDGDEKTRYSENKKSAYWQNIGHHRWRVFNYDKIGFYVPAPIFKDEMV